MYINFQHTRVSRSVKSVHLKLYAKNHKLHKFATTNNNKKKQLKPASSKTYMYLNFQTNLFAKKCKLHKLQLPIAIV